MILYERFDKGSIATTERRQHKRRRTHSMEGTCICIGLDTHRPLRHRDGS